MAADQRKYSYYIFRSNIYVHPALLCAILCWEYGGTRKMRTQCQHEDVNYHNSFDIDTLDVGTILSGKDPEQVAGAMLTSYEEIMKRKPIASWYRKVGMHHIHDPQTFYEKLLAYINTKPWKLHIRFSLPR